MVRNPNRPGPLQVRFADVPSADPAVPQSPPSSAPAQMVVEAGKAARMNRRNAIRRRSLPPLPFVPDGPAPDFKDIEIHGDLVNRALGLPLNPRPAPRHALAPPPPPTAPPPINYSTRPQPPATEGSSSPGPRRRPRPMNILFLDGLVDEVRKLPIDDEDTKDDST